MNQNSRIGFIEAVSLCTLLIITKVFYTSLRTVVKSVGTSGWIMTSISCITSIIVFLLIYMLMKRFEGKDLFEIFEIVMGNVIGKLLTLIISAYFIYYAGVNLREFVEMIKAYNLPYTPPSIIIGVVVGTAVFLTLSGLESIARVTYQSLFAVITGIVIILVLAIPEYNPLAVVPIFGYGLDKTIYNGLLRSSAYSEVIILAIFIKSLQGLKNFKRVGLTSLILSGLILAVSILLYTLAFDYTEGSESLSGLFQLSRLIYYNRFIQRLESIFIFIWSASSLLLVAISLLVSITAYCKTFRIENHRPLVLPFAFLLFMISLIPKNLSEVTEIHIMLVRQYGFIVTYGIPIIVLIISLILGKKGDSRKIENT